MASPITTHVLDTSRGRPAAGMKVGLVRYRVERHGEDEIEVGAPLGEGVTDADGRLRTLLPDGVALEPGTYEITFDTGSYFEAQGLITFYPSVSILFRIRQAGEHYHVPLLVAPFGYSTYRGS